MKKIVNLMGNVARLEDLEPFIIGVNDFLDLEFKSVYYLPTDLVICLKNGKLQENFRVKDAKLNVPGNFLFSGKLEITVSLLVNGDVAKKWACVPIIIKETDTEITAFDELTALQKDYVSLKNYAEELNKKCEMLIKKFDYLATKHNELSETVSAIKENY